MYNKVGWRLGKTLDGRYEILSVLGIGGMAVVYKAFDHKLKRNVAIKVLRDDVAMDAQSRRRFRTEYQAVGMLSHPNIRAVYDVVSSGDTEYIVMEYVDGINLKQYLKKKGVLSWKEALHFSTQIAKALSHAHSKGIVHMDIKPQNIILPKDGTAKVADFGIAQLEEGENDDGNAEEAVGSIHYISPEQARGEAVDARSDIYSLGVVMYEMFTGQLPFDGESVAEVAVKHFTVTPPAPSSINPDIPPELEEITLRAMQPNPNDRYQSAEELLADLEDFRKGQTAAIGDVVRQALAAENVRRSAAAKDEIHIVAKNVPRISRAGELSKQGYARRRSRAGRISTLLGFAIVIVFALGLFAFVWNYWLEGIFQDAERMNVPDFVGQTLESITSDESMTDLFDFSVVYKADASNPVGSIIGQSPAAGSSRMIVPEGIEVELTVSSGVQLVTVPDVLNQPYNEAQVSLQSMGLNVEVELVASDSITANYVISTDPQAGSSISSGSTVQLLVSAGPTVTYVTVPDVVGQEKTAALLDIQQAGLVCAETEITYISSTDEEKGLVLWQNYTSGTEVVTGTKLYLQIGSGSGNGQ
jgi:serine/threonine-protein kinase